MKYHFRNVTGWHKKEIKQEIELVLRGMWIEGYK